MLSFSAPSAAAHAPDDRMVQNYHEPSTAIVTPLLVAEAQTMLSIGGEGDCVRPIRPVGRLVGLQPRGERRAIYTSSPIFPCMLVMPVMPKAL